VETEKPYPIPGLPATGKNFQSDQVFRLAGFIFAGGGVIIDSAIDP
jgi:hypothetical protein